MAAAREAIFHRVCNTSRKRPSESKCKGRRHYSAIRDHKCCRIYFDVGDCVTSDSLRSCLSLLLPALHLFFFFTRTSHLTTRPRIRRARSSLLINHDSRSGRQLIDCFPECSDGEGRAEIRRKGETLAICTLESCSCNSTRVIISVTTRKSTRELDHRFPLTFVRT